MREPREMFLMSQLPPCSRGGMVRAASLAAVVERVALHPAEQTPVSSRRRRQRRDAVRVGGDQLRLALVPLGQQLVARQAADQAGMRDAGEAHARMWREVA